VIANLSKSSQKFSNPIRLPGVICSADVWVQSSYSMYQGLTTDVEIINSSTLIEHFDVYFSNE
jgi:hypothetical protein